ncbi:MAG: cytochrome c biogenesis CcdA family protein [Candidatus Aquicultorales bacterium]
MNLPDLGSVITQYPLAAFAVAFAAGLVTSLGPCTFARSVTFMGYVGSETTLSKTKGFFLAFLLLVGITVSYSSLGLVGFIASNIADIGKNLYYFVGMVAVVMGLHYAGVVRFRIPVPAKIRELKERHSRYRGPVGSFVLGTLFGLMLCPCCLPGLLTIFALTFAKGQLLYGFGLVFAYTLGHGVPLLAVGVFTGGIRVLSGIQRWREHISLATGTLMIIAGFVMLWMV